jgi:hypothetical protein
MTYFTKGLLTLLISLFILNACKNPTGIGLDVSPDEEVQGKSMTLPVIGQTERDAASRSVDFGQTVFGYFKDPAFGLTRADLSMEIGVPSSFPHIFIDAIMDSAILVLPYGLDYYGDTSRTEPIRLLVRQLNEPFAYNTSTSKVWAVKDQVLGSVTIPRYGYRDSVYVNRHINGKDTVVRDLPQLRIPLNAEFFKTLFAVDSASIASFQAYRNHTKGLYLSVDTTDTPSVGGLVTFRAINSRSGIDLVYRQHNGLTGEDAKVETYRTYFPINPESQSSIFGLGLASAVHTEYLPHIAEVLDSPEKGEERIYLQGAAGLRGKLTLSALDSIKAQNLAISKAELILPLDDQALGTVFSSPSQRITLYREDVAGQRQLVPDGDTRISSSGVQIDARNLGIQGFGGFFDSVRKRYVFNLTSYVQDVLLGKIKNTTVFIAPAHPLDQYVPYQPVLSTGSRTVIKGTQHPTEPIQLKLYYKEVN